MRHSKYVLEILSVLTCICLLITLGVHECIDTYHTGRGESKRHSIRVLSEPYPLVTIRARKMSELKVPNSADKGSH